MNALPFSGRIHNRLSELGKHGTPSMATASGW